MLLAALKIYSGRSSGSFACTQQYNGRSSGCFALSQPLVPTDWFYICLYRHKGVLQVWVLEAKELHQQDVGGKADPFVQLQTRLQDMEKTVQLPTLILQFNFDI